MARSICRLCEKRPEEHTSQLFTLRSMMFRNDVLPADIDTLQEGQESIEPTPRHLEIQILHSGHLAERLGDVRHLNGSFHM